MTVQHIDRVAFAQQWQQWHAEHESKLADPHGFLAVTSLNWLSATPARFGDAPGSWSSTGAGVTVQLAEDEHLIIDGATVHGSYSFGVIGERDSGFAGFGDAVVEGAKRGGYDIVRPRHPGHPLRMNFAGVPAYDPDPRWVAAGRYIPFERARDVTVGAAVEGLQHVYVSPGQLEFTLGGTFRLT